MSYESVSWMERAVFDKVAAAWGWMEVHGWYVLAGLIVCLIALPHVQRFVRSVRSQLRAPSEATVVNFKERQRLARLRQEERAEQAAEEHAEHEREKRARQVEEHAESLGMRPRSGGRRLGTGEEDDDGGVPPVPARPKPASKRDTGPDPFKRARNPLGPDSSRGHAPSRRQAPGGRGGG
mmetsp:Transcript_45391/g.72851  ORF Transcript_45391/g.72851 Transcript_45391/m.72851 type:complete len:180 (-) Transcript_45391:358-897(-)